MTKESVDPTYAGDGDYKAVINEIAEAGVCPFCPENFRWHPNPILQREGGWLITESMRPYDNTAHHLMLIPERHYSHITDLSAGDWMSISHLIAWACAEFNIVGGGLAMRFGPMTHTGSTVQHLHAHLMVPQMNPETERAQVVYFPLG